MKPHIYADVIKAWAEGLDVQWAISPHGPWKTVNLEILNATPDFHEYRWRIKPAPELHWIYYDSGDRIIGGTPTAADALAYAEKLLVDPGEFHCTQTDYRMPGLSQIRQLLEETKDEH